jgi:predicted transposase YdaD
MGCEVKILYDGAQGDIINQYIRFCHIFNEQVKLHGRTRKAVEETIRICRSEAVLEEYLEMEREEVIDMMLALFDEETLMKNHDAAIERKGRKEGRKKGRKEGKAEALVNLMKNLKWNLEQALRGLSIPESEWDDYREMVKALEANSAS